MVIDRDEASHMPFANRGYRRPWASIPLCSGTRLANFVETARILNFHGCAIRRHQLRILDQWPTLACAFEKTVNAAFVSQWRKNAREVMVWLEENAPVTPKK